MNRAYGVAMRLMLIAVLASAACSAQVEQDVYHSKVGDSCDSSTIGLCNDGHGLCAEGACRDYCAIVTPNQVTRCGASEREFHLAFDTTPDTCVCVDG